MARHIDGVMEIADAFDAVVLDQWGVLHDGTRPYDGAAEAMHALHGAGLRLAVLSNSGKRAAPNRDRIARIGLPVELLDAVTTSGEALWRDIERGALPHARLHPIEREPGDAERWAEGLDVALTGIDEADAVLLMGLPDDGGERGTIEATLAFALERGLAVLCSNPDRASPRAGGRTVGSPGDLAHAFAARGGTVHWYGKPHPPVFHAVTAALGEPERILMVGDSPEHDIAGATAAGWRSLLVRDGLHATAFEGAGTCEEIDDALRALIRDDAWRPDYTIARLAT